MGSIFGWLFCDDFDSSNIDSTSECDEGDFGFTNIDFERVDNFDCILVFDEGSREKEWKYSQYESIQYEYLKLLDPEDIEDRKNRFPHHGADWRMDGGSDKITIYDFNKNERKLVIKALKKQDLKCKSVHSLNRDNKYRFYYIGISEDIARKWADKIGYNLQIEPDGALTYLSLHNENLAKATLNNDDPSKSNVKRSFWKNIYIKYDINVAPQIYKEYYDNLDYQHLETMESTLFTMRDRITIINDVISQDIEVGGAGIYIPKLQQQQENNHCIIDFFPLHTLQHLQIILNKLFSFSSIYRIFNLPLTQFRCYFGEYFAIYFAFLQFITIYFIPLVIIGLIFGIIQIIYNQILISYIWIFAIFVIIWAILCPIIWKKKEIIYVKKWGTLRFTENMEERVRPEFIGNYRTSIIDGKEEEYFDPTIQNTRKCIAFSIVLTFFIALIGSIIAVILLRIYVTSTQQIYGSYIIAAVNTFIIMFFNNIYGIIAEKLNIWENYKTETEYEDNLIIKIFIFRFINSYASLYYIAFVRIYEYDSSLYCSPEQCMNDLRIQLSFIFLSQLIINNILELLPLFITRFIRGNYTLSFFSENESDFIYNQYISSIYGRTFDDYCELLIIYGYSTLFVISFPFSPLFAFIAYIVEARIDGYKLCKLSRRPFPRQCQSIGSWQLALEIMSWSILITNIFIICFTTKILDIFPTFLLKDNDIYFQEVLTSIILIISLLILLIIINQCIGGKSRDIIQHIKRTNHIEIEIKQIGHNIDKYIDNILSSKDNDLENWNVNKVSIFLHKLLFKNNKQFENLKKILKTAQFDGKQFAKCNDLYLEQKLNLKDDKIETFYIKKFILNAKKQLTKHQQLAQHQNSLVASVSLIDDDDDDDVIGDDDDDVDDEQSVDDDENTSDGHDNNNNEYKYDSYQYEPPSTKRTISRRPTGSYFNFKYENLYGMALFFENELKGQSKRKLWRRIEKDMVDVVQKHELDSFLYLTMIVYVKGKYPNVRVPKYKDKDFRKTMLNPLKKWLLDFKISPPGLTLEQFNTYYPCWIREFYNLKKNESISTSTAYESYQSSPITSTTDRIQIEISSPSKKAKKYHQRHRVRRERGTFLIPICENKSDENKLSENELLSETEIDHEIRMKTWNKECNEWFNRMKEISDFIETTMESTRIRIWDKFDKQNKEKLDTSKYLPKLIYSFIVLCIKSKNKKLQPPKYKMLHSLMKYYANDIIQILPMQQKSYLTKYHFHTNIQIYFRKIVKKRSKLIHIT